MKVYEGSSYGFCEECRKTDIPTTIEYPDGTFGVICPTCAAAEYETAEAILPDACAFRGCDRIAVTLCSKCEDAICTFHENKDGMCDVCSPVVSSYNRGWTGHGFSSI